MSERLASGSSERVAFLCLGAMGAPLAGHLAAAGHEVAVYNRSDARAEAWLASAGEGP